MISHNPQLSNVTSEGVAHLRGLKQLEVLRLHGEINNDTLEQIGELTNLTQLILQDNQKFQSLLTSQGIAHLANLQRLEDVASNSESIRRRRAGSAVSLAATGRRSSQDPQAGR